MTPDKTTNLKNIEQLKKELDTMHRLFDNLKSKNKKSTAPKEPFKEDLAKSKNTASDNLIFKTPKFPDLKSTDKQKTIEKTKDAVVPKKEEKDTSDKKIDNQKVDFYSSEPTITLEFDNEELKSIKDSGDSIQETILPNKESKKNPSEPIPQKKPVIAIDNKPTQKQEKIVLEKENTNKETTNHTVSKKEVGIKKIKVDSKLDALKPEPIINNDIAPKSSTIPAKKPIEKEITDIPKTIDSKKVQKETNTEESYLSIKEKLEQIKADIKKREVLKEQDSKTSTTITKIIEKNKLNSEKIKASFVENSNPNKDLNTTETELSNSVKKTEVSSKKEGVQKSEPSVTKPKVEVIKKEETQKPNPLASKPKVETVKKVETQKTNPFASKPKTDVVKKIENKISKSTLKIPEKKLVPSTNKVEKSKPVAVKSKKTKTNKDKKTKTKGSKLDILSITILTLVIIFLLLFWFLYIK